MTADDYAAEDDEVAQHVYMRFVNPSDPFDPRRHWYADLAQDGEHLAGPFGTASEARSIVRAALRSGLIKPVLA